MTRQDIDRKHHYLVEHMWRLLRAAFLLTGSALWLYTSAVHSVMLCLLCAAVVDQFRGFICKRIERMLHWKEDFDDLE